MNNIISYLNHLCFSLFKVCWTKDTSYRGHICVKEDKVMATNGHIGAMVEPIEGSVMLDYSAEDAAPRKEVCVDRDQAKEMYRSLKALKAEPQDQTRCVKYSGDLLTLDCPERKQEVKVNKDMDSYPPLEKCIPNYQDPEQYTKVVLDVEKLKILVDLAREFTPKNDKTLKAIQIYVPKDPWAPTVTSSLNRETGQQLTQIIMPMRE